MRELDEDFARIEQEEDMLKEAATHTNNVETDDDIASMLDRLGGSV